MKLFYRLFFVLALGVVILLVVLQVASGFFLKPLLEREGRRIFRVPVHIERAGANIAFGSIWMKGVRIKNAPGFSEPDMLFARTIAIDLNMLSLLTSEFVIDRVLLKDPVITVEVNVRGEWNMTQFAGNAIYRFEKMIRKKRKFVHMVKRYELEKFAVRHGLVQFIDARQSERDWTWGSITFSLARLVFPADPEEALPVAVYLNATAQGESEGQMLLIGRLNPFAEKKSYDVTGSAKNILLGEYNYFFPRFPLAFTGGALQVKMKALCHDNQVDFASHVRIDRLRLAMKKGFLTGSPKAFGLPAETVANYFNELWPEDEPFEFSFRVTGDLDDPGFDIVSQLEKEIHRAVSEPVNKKMNDIVEATKEIARDALLKSETLSSAG